MLMKLKGNDISFEMYEDKVIFIEKGIFFFPLSTTKIYEIFIDNIVSVKINKASLIEEASIEFTLSGEDKLKEHAINPIFFKKEYQEDYEKFISIIEEKIRKRKNFLFILSGSERVLELYENYIVIKKKEIENSKLNEEKTIIISDILSVQLKQFISDSGYLQFSLYGGATDTIIFTNVSENIIAEQIKDYILTKKLGNINSIEASNITEKKANGCLLLIVWIILILVILGALGGIIKSISDRDTTTGILDAPVSSTSTLDHTSEVEDTLPMGQRQALQKAESYINNQPFSAKGLYDQLKYEGFSEEDAEYAINNISVDWNEQAVKKAKSYLENQSFSRQGLIEQLLYEGFSESQANYGVEQVGY